MTETDINKLFFELIRVAIGNQACLPRTPKAKEWQELYAIAKKQSLVGICFAGVQKLQAQRQAPNSWGDERGEMLYLQWMGMAAKIQQRSELVYRQSKEMQDMLRKDGFMSCVLKGASVAWFYEPTLRLLRQSGDIDLWVNAPRDMIIDYVMKNAPTDEVNYQHVHFHLLKDTDVELHMVPVKRYNPRRNRLLQEYFDSEVERQCSNVVDMELGGETISLSCPTCGFQLVHQLLHVYGHYVYEGVGLRQLMDLYFAQLACYNANDRSEQYEKVRVLFRELGLMRFVAAAQWVLYLVFGLSQNQMLCEPDPKEGEQMLAEIMEGGNFGHFSEKNNVRGESFGHRMCRRMLQNVRMIRYDILGIICAPYYRLCIALWRRSLAKKYNLNKGTSGNVRSENI